MNTVIFKWNPAISSYPMLAFLYDMMMQHEEDVDFDWSVWDYDKIHEGDRFYWLKVGYGQTGIVGSGTVTCDPYQGEDWSGKGRKTYYVDFRPDVLLYADAFELLSSARLTEEIPDFDWNGGHSGLVLNDEQAARLDGLWRQYLADNMVSICGARRENAWIDPETASKE